MAKGENVEIPKEEYERLKEAHERLHAKSGRMSLRIPPDIYKALVARSDKTGRGKTKIVLDALKDHLTPAKSGLFD